MSWSRMMAVAIYFSPYNIENRKTTQKKKQKNGVKKLQTLKGHNSTRLVSVCLAIKACV